ncbi:hypothetical protein HPB48_025801 [Haemaphysalis longicornis]|uniref:TIL domain-containing protein n=1 Tax=Haemaphysalis longicornis TaxID=44386 RepID=A0A9J6HAV7_HAELO|nr:hypothetical protein HPB48_025801 [Haemaphysalis longicornis]
MRRLFKVVCSEEIHGAACRGLFQPVVWLGLLHPVVPVRGLPNGSRCGPGEVLKYCQSSTCGERTCASPGPPTHCTADCRTSCFCEDGFFRNRAKRCVPLALCS